MSTSNSVIITPIADLRTHTALVHAVMASHNRVKGGYKFTHPLCNRRAVSHCRFFAYYFCLDCGVDTVLIHEYYMVKHDLWQFATCGADEEGMLCLDCLEGRIGRPLETGDLLDCPLNENPNAARSAKLQQLCQPLVQNLLDAVAARMPPESA